MTDPTKYNIDYVALGYQDGLKNLDPKHSDNPNYMKGYERAIDRQVRKGMKNINGIFN